MEGRRMRLQRSRTRGGRGSVGFAVETAARRGWSGVGSELKDESEKEVVGIRVEVESDFSAK
jgi:hypothetical protein